MNGGSLQDDCWSIEDCMINACSWRMEELGRKLKNKEIIQICAMIAEGMVNGELTPIKRPDAKTN